MDLTKLTDQEKSVMLARAMGWDVETKSANPWSAFTNDEPNYIEVIFYKDAEGYLHETCDFYTDHMEVAWRVLNWAAKRFDIYEWWDVQDMPEEEPAVAQRAWLDKILELCIEAGIVEVEHELD